MNRSRGLLRSSERLSSAEIRMLESGLRVDVSTWAIEAVVAMMEGYQDAGETRRVNTHDARANKIYIDSSVCTDDR